MAYNTGFPVTYPQYYPQINNYPTQQNGTNIIWVQGLEAAKAYQIAPGVTLPLWDSDAQVIYLKSCDASGMPSMKIIDYTIRTEPVRKAQNALSGNTGTVPTMQDLNALQGQIDALKQQIERLGHESTLSADAVTAEQQPASTVSAIQTGIPG